jgi:peptidoglycan/LPS O-acetylase OafA/YrhL
MPATASGSPSVHPTYRPDIDGLRAVAVLAVVCFHAYPGLLKSGFVGVDVFFVISGYLITGGILADLEGGRFRFADFYSRRIRRIFPSLLLVLFTALALGYLFLLPIRMGIPFDRLGGEIAAGAAFISNYVFWKQAGYFDAPAAAKPLLHLWSLAIEEQFYIVWPLILGLAWKRRWNFLLLASAVAAASFSRELFQMHADANGAFYSPLSRFWELMLGGILASRELRDAACSRVWDDSLSFLGLALIGVAVCAFERSAFPGWRALAPASGAFLLIFVGAQASVNRRLLSRRELVLIGRISYPLYLWHWPMLYAYSVFFEARLTHAQGELAKGAGIVFCLILSRLTYRFVEMPIRTSRAGGRIVRRLCAAMLVVGLLGLCADKFGLPDYRLSRRARARVEALRNYGNMDRLLQPYRAARCFRSDPNAPASMFVDRRCFDQEFPGRPVVFVLGDSHAASLMFALRPYLRERRISAVEITSGWYTPFSNRTDAAVQDIDALALREIAQTRPDVVLLDADWLMTSHDVTDASPEAYFSRFLGKLKTIRGLGVKKIIVVGQIPTWSRGLPTVVYEDYMRKDVPLPERSSSAVSGESLAMDARMSALDYPKGIEYLSLKNLLCDSSGCLLAVGPHIEDDLVVWDYGHLTASGARAVVERLVGPKLIALLTKK